MKELDRDLGKEQVRWQLSQRGAEHGLFREKQAGSRGWTKARQEIKTANATQQSGLIPSSRMRAFKGA